MKKTALVIASVLALLMMIQPAAAGPLTVTTGPAGAITGFKPPVVVSTDGVQAFLNDDTVVHEPRADNDCFDLAGIPANGGTAVADLSGCGAVTTYFCERHPLTMHGVIIKA
jgi:hypothetical protein